MFAVCLVHLVLVQSQATTCTSNQPDTDCTASNSCRDEHPPEGTRYEQYIDDTCDPGFSSRTYSMPAALESQLCPNYVSCDVAADSEESTRYEGRPEVNVGVETASFYRFDMHISWEHNPVTSREGRRGYQIQVRNERGIVECFCVNDRDARNLTVTGSSSLNFGSAEDLTVEVAPYPLPNSIHYVSAVTGRYYSNWPSSCLDLGTHNCYPPTYPPPSNVQLHLCSESVQAMRLNISWDTVLPNSSWNYDRHKFTYYIQLQSLEPFPGDDPLRVSDYFRVTSFQNTISVSLFPLNISVEYTNIRLLTHYPCSGLATEPAGNVGCGNPSSKYSFPPPSLPSATDKPILSSSLSPPVVVESLPPPLISPPDITQSVPSLSMPPVLSESIPPQSHSLAVSPIIAMTVFVTLLVIIIIVLLIVIALVVHQARKKSVSEHHSNHSCESCNNALYTRALSESQSGSIDCFSESKETAE